MLDFVKHYGSKLNSLLKKIEKKMPYFTNKKVISNKFYSPLIISTKNWRQKSRHVFKHLMTHPYVDIRTIIYMNNFIFCLYDQIKVV